MRVVLRARALHDLQAIRQGDHFADPAAARRFYARLLDACDSLADYPERGRPARRSGTRELVTVRPYVVSYRVGEGEVAVLRILHGARLR